MFMSSSGSGRDREGTAKDHRRGGRQQRGRRPEQSGTEGPQVGRQEDDHFKHTFSGLS